MFLETLIWILFGTLLVRFVIWPIAMALSPKLHATIVYQDYQRDVARRGLSPDEAETELNARVTLAKLRRVASERVLLEPRRVDEIIQELSIEYAEAMEITHGRFEAHNWLKVVAGLKWTDILYDDALAVAMANLEMPKLVYDPIAESDLRAAMTVRN